jgi:hypothetical protein
VGRFTPPPAPNFTRRAYFYLSSVTSGVDLSQNHRVKFREAASAGSPDSIEDAAVLGPIKAKPFGWPRSHGQP